MKNNIHETIATRLLSLALFLILFNICSNTIFADVLIDADSNGNNKIIGNMNKIRMNQNKMSTDSGPNWIFAILNKGETDPDTNNTFTLDDNETFQKYQVIVDTKHCIDISNQARLRFLTKSQAGDKWWLYNLDGMKLEIKEPYEDPDNPESLHLKINNVLLCGNGLEIIIVHDYSISICWAISGPPPRLISLKDGYSKTKSKIIPEYVDLHDDKGQIIYSTEDGTVVTVPYPDITK